MCSFNSSGTRPRTSYALKHLSCVSYVLTGAPPPSVDCTGLTLRLYYARSSLLGSSMVEHLAVNQGVAGSSPARGAIVFPTLHTQRVHLCDSHPAVSTQPCALGSAGASTRRRGAGTSGRGAQTIARLKVRRAGVRVTLESTELAPAGRTHRREVTSTAHAHGACDGDRAHVAPAAET